MGLILTAKGHIFVIINGDWQDKKGDFSRKNNRRAGSSA
jgi:hypothetical protein